MNDTILNLLQAISDTRGFMMFCVVIAVAYASIWTLFLFEAPPKKKKPKQSANKEGAEDDEAPRKAPPKKQKQAA